MADPLELERELTAFAARDEREWLQSETVSPVDKERLLAELRRRLTAWRTNLKPTREQLLQVTHEENRIHARLDGGNAQFWEGLDADWRRKQKPSDWQPSKEWSPEARQWFEEQQRAGNLFPSEEAANTAYVASQRPDSDKSKREIPPDPEAWGNPYLVEYANKQKERQKADEEANVLAQARAIDIANRAAEDREGKKRDIDQQNNPKAPTKPPLSKWSVWIQRGVLTVAAGLAWWLFEKFDAPVWLVVLTLIVCLVSFVSVRSLEKTEGRKKLFIGFLVVYASVAMIIVAFSKRSTEKPKQPVSTVHSAPSITPTLTPAPIETPVYPLFQAAYDDYSKELGSALKDAEPLANPGYYAEHEHAKAIWIQRDDAFYLLGHDYKWKRQPDKWGERWRDWLNDEHNKRVLRGKFGLPPKGKYPPYGGVALGWENDPSNWEWIGWRLWHCSYSPGTPDKTIHIQTFDRGFIIGGYARTSSGDTGQRIFVVMDTDQRWSARVIQSEGSPCGPPAQK